MVLPELPHFNILKLLQHETNEYLKQAQGSKILQQCMSNVEIK